MNSLISLKSINFNLKAVELSSTYNLIAYVVLFFVISNRFFSSVYLELNFAKHLFQNLTSLLALINLIIFFIIAIIKRKSILIYKRRP